MSVVKKCSISKKKRRTQQSKKIGLAGEEHVYEYEYNKLKNLKKKDLADKIKKHFEVYEYPGWDITSFDKDGHEGGISNLPSSCISSAVLN